MDFRGAIISNRGVCGEQEGYSLIKLRSVTVLGIIPVRTEFKLTLAPAHPLCARLADGTVLVPNFTFTTDFGSTFPLNMVFDPMRYLAYLFHDSACRFGGLYDDKGNFIPMSRRDADALLYHLLKFEGAWLTTRGAIYAGVRIGALAGIGVPDGDLAKKPVALATYHRSEEFYG